MLIKFISAGLLLSVLSGCSGLTTYKNTSPVNLTINKQTDSDITTQAHVYNVNNKCHLNYIGTIDVESKTVNTGLSINTLSFIEVQFSSSSFLYGDRSTSYGTLVKPKAGYHYDLNTRYIDSIYNVSLFERKSKSSRKKELDPQGIEQCRPTQ